MLSTALVSGLGSKTSVGILGGDDDRRVEAHDVARNRAVLDQLEGAGAQTNELTLDGSWINAGALQCEREGLVAGAVDGGDTKRLARPVGWIGVVLRRDEADARPEGVDTDDLEGLTSDRARPS